MGKKRLKKFERFVEKAHEILILQIKFFKIKFDVLSSGN